MLQTMRNILLPLIALGMLLFGASHIRSRQKETPQTQPPIPPAQSPYLQRVAGAGLVEAATENIAVGTHLPGIVDQVFVQVGQRVRANEPLFELDTRLIRAQIAVQETQAISSRAELSKLEQLPRPEDLPPVVARREQSEAILRQWEDEYARQQKLSQDGATTESLLVASRQKLAAARADAAGMLAEEQRLRAGAWEADRIIARAAVAMADAEVSKLKTELELHRVGTPELRDAAGAVELTVLQVNVRPGEAVDTVGDKALVMLGDVRRKHVRVDIDEHDVPRFEKAGAATGVLRGDAAKSLPLKFMRVEPFVLPKRSLTGDNTERVDTRVLQVLYQITADADAIFIGQQMDVFIEIPHP